MNFVAVVALTAAGHDAAQRYFAGDRGARVECANIWASLSEEEQLLAIDADVSRRAAASQRFAA